MLRLRQICLVAQDLKQVEDEFRDVFGLEVCHRDPAVAKFGLENFLMPIGRNFLEVVAPTQDGTTAGRYLERRGGDGGYIVILQCDDADRRRALYEKLGVRIAHTMDYGDFLGTQLHPKDVGACMLEVDRQDGDAVDGAWHPAGGDWEGAVRTERVRAMIGCSLQSQAPLRLAERWGEALDRPAKPGGDRFRIELDNGAIDVTSPGDDRGDGLIGVTLRTSDRAAIVEAAKARGLPASFDRVTICGTHFDLVEPIEPAKEAS